MVKKIIIQDKIAGKNKAMTCGSSLLEDFISPYNSTIVEKLEELSDKYQYEMIRSSHEFAIEENNQVIIDEKGQYIIGTAIDVANEVIDGYDIAIATECKGDIKLSAAGKNLIGFTPSNGLISKYGVFQATNSFDNIGFISEDIDLIRSLFKDLSGYDVKDVNSMDYEFNDDPNIENSNIAYIGDVDQTIFENYTCEDNLINIDFDIITSIYLILSSVSFSSNTSKFDGIRFGKRTDTYKSLDELYSKTRGEYFTKNTKEKNLLGYYFLEDDNYQSYYSKAINSLKLIAKDFNEYFEKYDFIASPTFINENIEAFENYKNAQYTLVASLCGYPSITIPVKGENILIYSKRFNDDKLIKLAKEICD